MTPPPPQAEDVAPWDRRRDGRALLLLFVIVWGVYLATATYTITQVNDTRETAISAWSLASRGTLALPDEWDAHPDAMRWDLEGRGGHTYTNRFPGTIAWGAPFYAAAEPFWPSGEPPHPWLVNFAPGGVAAATVSAIAIAVWFAVFRQLVDRRMAVGAAATLAFATGMWSVAATALWTHGPGALALGLGVLALSRNGYAAGGVAFAAGILIRPHLAIVPAVMGLWEGARRRALHPVLVVGALSGLGLAAMSLYSWWFFDTWMPVAGYDPSRPRGVVATGGAVFAERLLLWAAHPLRGMLLYTPVLLVLLPGLGRAWRAAPTWARASGLAGILYIVVQLRVNVWHGGGDHFGNRLGLEMLVLLTPLLLLAFRHFILPARPLRWIFGVLVTASIALHAVGATVERTGFYGFDGATQWQKDFAEVCEDEPELCDEFDV